jgi:hypothetical protein
MTTNEINGTFFEILNSSSFSLLNTVICEKQKLFKTEKCYHYKNSEKIFCKIKNNWTKNNNFGF